MISPLAYVHPDAKLGNNVTVEPFAYIAGDVEIGDDCWIGPGAVIHDGARIGKRNKIHTAASISCLPQDLKFVGEETTTEIGDNNTFRENVTVNRGTAAKNKTVVGSKNLFMEGVHIAHDDIVGNECIIGNGTKLAGEVTIDDKAILSAHVLVHQFTRIGSYCMVGGGTKVAQDILPYSLIAREPAAYCGLNVVGLRRRGFEREIIDNIHKAYQIILQETGLLKDSLARVEAEIPMSPEIEYILDFIRTSKRGFIR